MVGYGGKDLQKRKVYVATLRRETLMSAKQAINDKLQGSVATYLRCDYYPFNCKFTEKSSSIFLNRLRYDRIMVKSLRPRFFGPCCTCRRQTAAAASLTVLKS